MIAAVHVDSSRSNYSKADNLWLPGQGLSAHFRRLQEENEHLRLIPATPRVSPLGFHPNNCLHRKGADGKSSKVSIWIVHCIAF